MTAISSRSSMRVIRWGGTPSPPDICRTRSRSKVVLPPPGGDSSKVLTKLYKTNGLEMWEPGGPLEPMNTTAPNKRQIEEFWSD